MQKSSTKFGKDKEKTTQDHKETSIYFLYQFSTNQDIMRNNKNSCKEIHRIFRSFNQDFNKIKGIKLNKKSTISHIFS
jgi:hypothetical protein